MQLVCVTTNFVVIWCDKKKKLCSCRDKELCALLVEMPEAFLQVCLRKSIVVSLHQQDMLA